MSGLKPIGSEKLQGDAKVQRIMEIARFGETTRNKELQVETNHFTKKGADGRVYSIVLERDGYYLKSGINESELEYVSGPQNKKRDRFKSYGKALKRMNLIFKPLNEEYNEGTGMSMYDESEMDEQEKFVLNVPDEGGDEESVDVDMDLDMGDEDEDLDMDMDDEEEDLDVDLEGGDEEEMEGFMKPIQKLTGKLGQKLRDVEEELGSADIKYVLNSIISAVDLDNLDEDDKDDVLDRFDEDEAAYGDEEDVDVDIDMGDEDMDLDTEVGDEDSMDLDMDDEEVAMESLKERVGNLLESYIETGKKTKSSPNTAEQYLKSKIKHLQETKKLKKKYKTVEQELSCEKFLKENKSFKFKRKTDSGKIILESKNKKVWILTNGFIK
jgi:hypothetical protein|tara:strand:+ start:7536 stop:8684 length:1149 start_codon:yes stop_codon:yes gene_type:complete